MAFQKWPGQGEGERRDSADSLFATTGGSDRSARRLDGSTTALTLCIMCWLIVLFLYTGNTGLVEEAELSWAELKSKVVIIRYGGVGEKQYKCLDYNDWVDISIQLVYTTNKILGWKWWKWWFISIPVGWPIVVFNGYSWCVWSASDMSFRCRTGGDYYDGVVVVDVTNGGWCMKNKWTCAW